MDETKEAKVVLTPAREDHIMEAVYEYVMRVTEHSKEATPAELAVLPEMIKLLINFWTIPS